VFFIVAAALAGHSQTRSMEMETKKVVVSLESLRVFPDEPPPPELKKGEKAQEKPVFSLTNRVF
jgi:hypothetical protein